MWTIEEQKEQLKKLTDRFDLEGINYKEEEVNNKILFIYVLEGEYAKTKENKKKNGGFVPDFRISTHVGDPIGMYYVKDCGWVHFMSEESIIKKI